MSLYAVRRDSVELLGKGESDLGGLMVPFGQFALYKNTHGETAGP